MINLSEEELRAMVREMLSSGEVSEHDALYPKKKRWEEESRELRALLVDLLKHIEDDEYEEGVSKIDSVVFKLNRWKNKIEKFLK